MAIVKIDQPTPFVPGYKVGQTDYTQQNLLTQALALMASGARTYNLTQVHKGAIFSIGGEIYIADSDTALTGSGVILKVVPSGATATASLISFFCV